MKRIIVVIIAVFLLLSASGCAAVGQFFEIETQPTVTADLTYLPDHLFRIANSLLISMVDSDDYQHGPYLFTEIPANMELGVYTVEEKPDLSGYDFCLTIASGDDGEKLTIYDGYRDILCYENGKSVLYFRDSDGKTLEKLRRDFDAAEFRAKGELIFSTGGDPFGPLRVFAAVEYPALRKNLTAGSIYRYEEYDLVDFKVDMQTENRISGQISYYAKGAEAGMPPDAEPGTGRFEGWFYCTEEVLLEMKPDGTWCRVTAFNEDVPASDTTEASDDDTVTEYQT